MKLLRDTIEAHIGRFAEKHRPKINRRLNACRSFNAKADLFVTYWCKLIFNTKLGAFADSFGEWGKLSIWLNYFEAFVHILSEGKLSVELLHKHYLEE